MTTLGNPEQKLFLQWQPSDDVDGVYENGNRLAESMPGAFHTPKREGERQRLQRLVISWKNSSPLYKKNNGLICPYSKHFVVDIAWLLWPKPTSLADLIKSPVLCAIFSKSGRFWPYREGHLKVAFSFDHALSAGEAFMDKSNDQDRGKGAAERDQKNEGGNSSMPGQLGHRDEDEELKNADSGLSG